MNNRQRLLMLALIQYGMANIDDVNAAFAAVDGELEEIDGKVSVDGVEAEAFNAEEVDTLYRLVVNTQAE